MGFQDTRLIRGQPASGAWAVESSASPLASTSSTGQSVTSSAGSLECFASFSAYQHCHAYSRKSTDGLEAHFLGRPSQSYTEAARRVFGKQESSELAVDFCRGKFRNGPDARQPVKDSTECGALIQGTHAQARMCLVHRIRGRRVAPWLIPFLLSGYGLCAHRKGPRLQRKMVVTLAGCITSGGDWDTNQFPSRTTTVSGAYPCPKHAATEAG